MKKGIIGENKNGLLEIKKIKFAYKALADLVKYENEDRLIIYNEIAKRDNLSLEEVEASQAKTLQDKAPHGTPIEVYNDSKQDFEWKIK